ncbi:MAG TPA: DUF2199 domain-containing protein [Acidimicrobiales bacterium]|nr:DUF2199 domain-containing protein [Acidimicrobiales bacterium]
MPDRRVPAHGVCRCGRPLDAHDRHLRFELPEPVLTAPDQDRAAGTWMTHEDARTSVMMQVPRVGAFVRCLLPVKLSGGFVVTFGVWLAVRPGDLQRAALVWREPTYVDLTLDGWLANRLPLWDCLASPAHASVEDPEHTPYVTSSSDALLARVLGEEWSHDEVLAAVPR